MPQRPHTSRASLAWCFYALATTLAAQPVQAAENAYPSKPITIVVGYPPGGSTDLVARLLGTELSARFKQTVVVENLGGAGGVIGAQKVARATADGYTLLVASNNEIAIAPLVNKAVKYDVFKDFTPVGLLATQPMVLVAGTSTGVKNASDFTKLVTAQPGKYSYGSSGIGTALHLAGEMVKESGHLKMTHVPYKGVAPLTNDLVGNNLEFGVFVLSSGLPHIKSGKVVPLGTTEATRSAVTPDIPALAESPLFKNVDINSWFALMAPAQLPPPIMEKLKAALNETLQSADFRAKMQTSGNVVASPAVDIAVFHQAEVAKYKKIVDFAKIED